MEHSPPSPVLEPMAGADQFWLRMDSPDNLMIIHGVFLFDQPLDRDRVEHLLLDRFSCIRRFRQRVVQTGGRFCWQDDPEFDLPRHLVEETLPDPGDDEQLRQLIGRRMSEPLAHDHPMWRVHLIANHHGGTAMLWRLHHSVADGIALMIVLLAMTDLEPDVDLDPGHEVNPLARLFREGDADPQEIRAYLDDMMPEGTKLMARPSEAMAKANKLVLGAGSVPALLKLTFRSSDNPTSLKGSLGIPKEVAWSGPIPLSEVTSLRERLGGTVNDILLTATAGGLRRYFERMGHSMDRINVRGLMPVSLRPLEELDQLGNRFGLIFLKLPLEIAHPRERLEALQQHFGGLKKSLEPMVALSVVRLLGHVPQAVQNLFVRFFATKGTAVVTSVPGPNRTLYCAGQPIRSMLIWVPQSARLGLGIAIGSYAGEVRLGVAGDPGLMGDPRLIVETFGEELDVMSRL